MLLVDGQGVPLSVMVDRASAAEVHLIEDLLSVRTYPGRLQRLIYDRAADSDALRERLAARRIELVCPHRRGRKWLPTQDGRKLRRYRHRWTVERTISWLFNSRRLVVRYERLDHLFLGFAQLACLMITLGCF
jgi:transposase